MAFWASILSCSLKKRAFSVESRDLNDQMNDKLGPHTTAYVTDHTMNPFKSHPVLKEYQSNSSLAQIQDVADKPESVEGGFFQRCFTES